LIQMPSAKLLRLPEGWDQYRTALARFTK
jgi:hypothetical protein